jgi:hypothetical protein
MREMRNEYTALVGKRDHSEDLDVDWIILDNIKTGVDWIHLT